MNPGEPTYFAELMKDSDRFMAEVNRAVHDTLPMHKLLGYPVVVWGDGQVVWIPPAAIPVNGYTNGEAPKLPPF